MEVRTLSGAGVSVLVCTLGAAFEMNWWWFGVFQLILQYYMHTDFFPRLHALHVLTWYTRGSYSVTLQLRQWPRRYCV